MRNSFEKPKLFSTKVKRLEIGIDNCNAYTVVQSQHVTVTDLVRVTG